MKPLVRLISGNNNLSLFHLWWGEAKLKCQKVSYFWNASSCKEITDKYEESVLDLDIKISDGKLPIY